MALPLPNPPREKPVDLPAFLEAIRGELSILERSLAGYTQLSRVYDQRVNGVPEGGRVLGIPQFHHKGSLDGRNVVECTPELSKAPPEFIPTVLSVFCNIHASDMMTAAGNTQKLVNQLVQMLRQALNAQADQTKAQTPVPVSAEGDDEEEEFSDIPVDEEPSEDPEDEEEAPPPPSRAERRLRTPRRRAQG